MKATELVDLLLNFHPDTEVHVIKDNSSVDIGIVPITNKLLVIVPKPDNQPNFPKVVQMYPNTNK